MFCNCTLSPATRWCGIRSSLVQCMQQQVASKQQGSAAATEDSGQKEKKQKAAGCSSLMPCTQRAKRAMHLRVSSGLVVIPNGFRLRCSVFARNHRPLCAAAQVQAQARPECSGQRHDGQPQNARPASLVSGPLSLCERKAPGRAPPGATAQSAVQRGRQSRA